MASSTVDPAVVPAADLAACCRALQDSYTRIAATRMAGVPVLNARLRVQTLGFEADAADPGWAWGVLLTPWFMNLLRWPLGDAARAEVLSPGHKAERACGTQRFEFVGTHEPGLGAFEAASLFSPMFEFADQAAAVATASEVLRLLRPPAPEVVAVPARRGFLFGRSAVGRAA